MGKRQKFPSIVMNSLPEQGRRSKRIKNRKESGTNREMRDGIPWLELRGEAKEWGTSAGKI